MWRERVAIENQRTVKEKEKKKKNKVNIFNTR